MIQTFVYITTQREFFHRYKDAPDEVAYLRNMHRHLLHINAKVEVFDADREIEFIMFKHRIDEYLDSVVYQANTSCETVAYSILNFIRDKYGNHRDIKIVVSEDGENGVEVVYRKEN